MVTVETLDSSVFLERLVASHPDLWQRALDGNMVVIVPQAVSLESSAVTRRTAEDHLLRRTPVSGEYVTVSGKSVTLAGMTTVRTGEGFDVPVTARAMAVKRLGGPASEAEPRAAADVAGGCTAMLVSRPLIGGVPAPTGVADMNDAMVRRVTALLCAHSDAEDVFGDLDRAAAEVVRAFRAAGPMLHRRSLRRPRDGTDPTRRRGWTFSLPSRDADAIETSSSDGQGPSAGDAAALLDSPTLQPVGAATAGGGPLLPSEAGHARRMSWSTDGGGSVASLTASLPSAGHAASLAPPPLRTRPERGLGGLDPPLDRLVALRCDAAARLLVRGSTFRGLTAGLGAHEARQAVLLTLSQLRQIAESRLTQALRVPIVHWLAVTRAAKTRRFAAGLALLRQRAREADDDFAAPPGFAVAGPIRCDFGRARRALLRCRLASSALGVQQCLRDCLRQVEACVGDHAASLGMPRGRLEIAAEDKAAIVVHLLVTGGDDDVIGATVDVGTVLAAARATGGTEAETESQATGAAGGTARSRGASDGGGGGSPAPDSPEGNGRGCDEGSARRPGLDEPAAAFRLGPAASASTVGPPPRAASGPALPVWERGRPLSLAQGGGIPDDVERGLRRACVVPDPSSAPDPLLCCGQAGTSPCSRAGSAASGACRAMSTALRQGAGPGAYASLDETRELTSSRTRGAGRGAAYGAINQGRGSFGGVRGPSSRAPTAATGAPDGGARQGAEPKDSAVAAAAAGGGDRDIPLSIARRARAAVRRCRAAAALRRRSAPAEAEVAVAAMQLCGGTESLLPFLAFGCALGRVSDPSAAGMELGYAAATVMQAVAVVCAQAPWEPTDEEEIDEDGI